MRGAKLNEGILEVRLIICEQVVWFPFSVSCTIIEKARSHHETQIFEYPVSWFVWILTLHQNSNAENVATQVLGYWIPNQGTTLEVEWVVQIFREMCERLLDVEAQIFG
jgi:hypothetical protein